MAEEGKTYEGELSFADAIAAVAAARTPSTPPATPPAQETSAPGNTQVEPQATAAQGTASNGGESVLHEQLAALKAEIEALKTQKAPERQPETAPVEVPQALELDFNDHFAIDPAGAITSLAQKLKVDPKALAEQLWYEGLGDKAPADYRASKEGKRGQLAAKMLEYRQQQERKQAEEHYANQQAEEVQNRYIGSLKSFVAAAPTDKTPLVSKLHAENPDMVLRGMWSHATTLASQSNKIPTPEEAAASLEKELQTLAKVFIPTAPAQTPAPVVSPPPAPSAPTTLRNQFSQTQPSRGDEDELSDEALRRKAFEALETARRNAL